MTTEYPKIEPVGNGYKVHISAKMALPGIYTRVFLADRAIKRYNGSMVEAKRARKNK